MVQVSFQVSCFAFPSLFRNRLGHCVDYTCSFGELAARWRASRKNGCAPTPQEATSTRSCPVTRCRSPAKVFITPRLWHARDGTFAMPQQKLRPENGKGPVHRTKRLMLPSLQGTTHSAHDAIDEAKFQLCLRQGTLPWWADGSTQGKVEPKTKGKGKGDTAWDTGKGKGKNSPKGKAKAKARAHRTQ